MSRPHDSRFPYLPGIDALRALAVLAVFGYHAGLDWLPGGFLGVDVFFAISGYLITSLLLAEFRADGHLRLARFWSRRARRLLPAVGVLVAVTIVAAAIADPERIGQIRGDALASLLYFANWHFIYAGTSYFEQFGRPSLFTHLWSLSVEEQFYLFWPLLFAAGMKLLGRRRLLLGVLAGAATSVALAWILFDPGGDASRVYYGTDTHAVGLLAGVALALLWSPIELRRRATGLLVGPVLDATGVVALGFLVGSFAGVHDYDLALWHGGYIWIALASAFLLAVLAHPAARLGAILGTPPLLWLGLRSYSFYLWHWPVLALTRPGIDVALPRGVLVPLQLLATLALADLSYRFVELPFSGKAKAPRLPAGWAPTARPALAATVVTMVVVVGWSGIVSAGDERSAAASTATVALVRARPPAARNPTTRQGGRAAPRRRHPPASAQWPRILALGDSVMIGAKDNLAARLGPGFAMSAAVGRQADEFIALVQRIKREGHHPDAMIVQWGNNGPLYGDDMEALHRATTNVGQLFLITDHAPVSWLEESNAALAEACEGWAHTTCVDWADVAAAHEDELYDGIHLKPAGAGEYARLVARTVREEIPFPPSAQRPLQRRG